MKFVLVLLVFLCLPIFSNAFPYEVIAKIKTAPGSIAVSPKGRVFLTLHPAFNPKNRLVELKQGKLIPFPNDKWQKNIGVNGIGFNSPLGIKVDLLNVLWVIDNASNPPRLVGWDLNSNELYKAISIPYPVSGKRSFINDIAVDLKYNKIYLTDTIGDKGAGIIAVDLKTSNSKRVLSDSASLKAERNIPIIINGYKGSSVSVGLKTITIDSSYNWLYYGSMHGRNIYRILTKHLANDSLNEQQLKKYVEKYSNKPVSEGITIDNAGNIYVTDVVSNGVGVIQADGSYKLLFTDKHLLWPASMAIGANNYIYVISNQLNLSPIFNKGKDLSKPPFYIIRFKSLKKATPGR